MKPAKDEDRIANALEFAVRFGGIDGAHHKTWVIDQMVRSLTGCRPVDPDADGGGMGTSEEYEQLVRDACDGDDGPDTYAWDEGIAP